MKKISACSLAMAFMMAGCGANNKQQTVGAAPANPVEPAAQNKEVLTFPVFSNTAADMEKACKDGLDRIAALRDQIKAQARAGQNEKTLDDWNTLLQVSDRLGPVTYLMGQVHPDEAVRNAANECVQKLEKLSTEMSLDSGLYEAFSKVDGKSLSGESKRFLDKIILDYKRSGVDKDEATRQKIAQLKEEEVKLGQEFQKAIVAGKAILKVKPEELEGMPEDFMSRHPVDAEGFVSVSTDYPDFFPVQNYCKNRETRAKLYKLFDERGYPSNVDTLKKLLQVRYDIARTLGYKDWATYNSEDKMIKTSENIDNFVNQISDLAYPKMEDDLQEMLAALQVEYPEATTIEVWDRFYYQRKIQDQKYHLDAQEVRSFFNFNDVKAGVLGTAQKLYGVTFVRDTTTPVWEKSVEAYKVMEGDEQLATFYLDMHPRAGKYGHAAMFELQSGINGVALPSASLVCNFPKPDENGLALMEHSDVTTFFHEFGHLMHQLVSGHHDYVSLSGITTEWDFVETPSQLFEEWAWDHAVLSTFAKNQAGQVISQELVNRMKAADEFGKGVHVARQMFYAALSYYAYAQDPATIDLDKLYADLMEKYSPYKLVPGTHPYCSFGHIEGYSSMYYTYMWSLVMAKDILTKFNGNLLDLDTFKSYRQNILAPGGSIDAAEMVKNFLGRDFSFDAYRDWLTK